MKRFLVPILAFTCIAACSSRFGPVSHGQQIVWQDGLALEAPYLLAPGDTIDVVVHTAPELSRSLVVAPDGRIRLPLAPSILATARSTDEVAADLKQALAEELIDPDLDVIATGFASQQVFVGGEVTRPGLFDLPGRIDALQAVIMAGGFTRDARPSEVLLMRRMPGGDISTTLIDLGGDLRDPSLAGWLPLQRFDIVYVPRSRIAQQNRFVQQYVRDALPLQFLLFYDVSGGRG